jgi:hypothetical protein
MIDATTDMDQLLVRAELLRGLGPLSVSAPARDDRGRYWLFINATIGGEMHSISHVVATDKRERDGLMDVYRRTIVDTLARRGFHVAAEEHTPEFGRLL